MITDSRVINFFRKTKPSVEITPGSCFRHVDRKVVETARVLAITVDPMGIPHVRFSVLIESSYQDPVHDGPRILNLRSFTERYSVPVQG